MITIVDAVLRKNSKEETFVALIEAKQANALRSELSRLMRKQSDRLFVRI